MLSQLLLSLLLSYSLNYSADWTISHLFPDMIAVNPKTHQASQGQMSLILLVQPQLWYQIIMQTWGYASRTSRQKALRLAVNSFCMWKRFNISPTTPLCREVTHRERQTMLDMCLIPPTKHWFFVIGCDSIFPKNLPSLELNTVVH